MTKQKRFIKLVLSNLSEKESDWLQQKIAIISVIETEHKFNVFFSLVPRFISNQVINWSIEEIKQLEQIYPGFEKSSWKKTDLARVVLMISLQVKTNKKILSSFFEIAEMQELIAIFKGLYLLENSQEYSKMVEEGIRTNMVNVFDSIIVGNPFAKIYLEEWAWNQLILKTFFLDRSLYNIQFIDQGKNENLALMLQDYIRERWAANRTISPEIWRMIGGYLRDDIRNLLQIKTFTGIEKEAIESILGNENGTNKEFWNKIGKNR